MAAKHMEMHCAAVQTDKHREQYEIIQKNREWLRIQMYGDGTNKRAKTHTLRDVAWIFRKFYGTQMRAEAALGVSVMSGMFNDPNKNIDSVTRAKLFIRPTSNRHRWTFDPDADVPKSVGELLWGNPPKEEEPVSPPVGDPHEWFERGGLMHMIKALAEIRGSQAALAQTSGVDKGYLSKLARGEKDYPSDDVLERLGMERRIQYRFK